MDIPDLQWDPLEETRSEVFRKYGRAIERMDFRMPDGSVHDFYLKREENSVVVLPLTEDGRVILASQYRPGPAKVLHELPGGGAEPGETPEATAARELLEETGYVGQMRFVTSCWDCAYSTCHRAIFVAENCTKVAEPALDETEFVHVTLMPSAEFRTLLRSGEMTDVEAGYLGLDFLGMLT